MERRKGMNAEKKSLLGLQVLLLFLAFAYIWGCTFFPLTPEGKETAKIVIPFLLGTVVGTLMNFNWGSSKGSRDQIDAAEIRLNSGLPPNQSKTDGLKDVEEKR